MELYTIKSTNFISGDYDSKKKKIKECHPYKNGYIQLDNIALENVDDFYLLPNDRSKLKNIKEDSIFLYVFGFKNKRPILGMLRLNPYEFFNGHGLTADFMQEKLGIFDYAISGMMLKKQNGYLINDHSGHFDESVNTYLLKKYKDFNVVKYFNLFFKKHFNKFIGNLDFVSFIDKRSEKIEANAHVLNDFLSRVCTPDAEIPVFDSKQNCEKNTKLGYKGNICNKLDNIIFEDIIQKEVKEKLKRKYGLNKLRLIRKLLLNTINKKELRILMNEFNIHTVITDHTENLIKNKILRKLNLTKSHVSLIDELIKKKRTRSLTISSNLKTLSRTNQISRSRSRSRSRSKTIRRKSY